VLYEYKLFFPHPFKSKIAESLKITILPETNSGHQGPPGKKKKLTNFE